MSDGAPVTEPTTPPVPERSTPKARATRARLIDVAGTVFVDAGYASTSVRDVAEQADMTTGAIYGHFRGKADLLSEAVRRRLEDDLRDHGGRPYDETTVAAWVAHSFADFPTRRAMRALLVEAAAAARVDPEVREPLRDVLEDQLGEWAALYDEIWAREHLDPDVDPGAAMRLFFAMEVGLGIFEALGLEVPAPETAADLVRRFLDGLRPEAPLDRKR